MNRNHNSDDTYFTMNGKKVSFSDVSGNSARDNIIFDIPWFKNEKQWRPDESQLS